MAKQIPLDYIENPWPMRNGVIIFDIETSREEDFSLLGKKSREFKCGVAYSYQNSKYETFSKPQELVEFLKGASVLVTYNGEGFDYLVLEKYGFPIKPHKKDRWVPADIRSCDIMHEIHDRRPRSDLERKFLKLDEMILSHYGVHKTPFDPEDTESLLKHCIEDVKFTKMLYEERLWFAPIVERPKLRKWDTDYDDDVCEIIGNGEDYTRIVDYGLSLTEMGSVDYKEWPNTISCPVCEKGELFMYHVLRCRDDDVKCPECSSIITFSTGTCDITRIQTQKEIAENICPNCGKSLVTSGHAHYGYGAGAGYISSGRSICKSCSKGCYEWENDDTPGFRDHYVGKCCFCGE